MCFFG
jgi:hypothetical protein